MALRVGLTGGVGSGKSTVAERFTEHGVPVIDADRIAREVVAPGSPGLAALVDAFGTAILTPEGALNRPELRRRIFADPQERQRLEGLLHPRIRQEMARRAARVVAPYVLLVIPLLIEQGWQELVDRILVVDASEAEQIRRTAARDRVPPESVHAIIASQASREARLRAADDVIVNDRDPEMLAARVDALHRHYLQLAAGSSSAEQTPSH